jgi:ribosomal protein L16/L10AE
MVVFDTSLREIKIQKRRGLKLSKSIKLNYGEYAIISANESKMELIQFTLLKRMIKKLVKKRKKIKSKGRVRSSQVADSKTKSKNYKIWVNLLPNYIISKKSKNSRMGKGKGSFSR